MTKEYETIKALEVDIDADASKVSSGTSEAETAFLGMQKIIENALGRVEASVSKVVNAVNRSMDGIKEGTSRAAASTRTVDRAMRTTQSTSQTAMKAMDQSVRAAVRGTISEYDALTSAIENTNLEADIARRKLETIGKAQDVEREKLKNLEAEYAHQNSLHSQKAAERAAELQGQIAKATAKINQYENQMGRHAHSLDQQGRLYESLTAKIEGLRVAQQSVVGSTQETASKQGLLSRATERVKQGFAGIGSVARKALLTAKRGLENATHATEKMGGTARRTIPIFETLKRRLRSAFIITAIIAGIRKLAQYIGGVAKTNKQFANSLATIKGNLLTAFAPIYNAILPALNTLMGVLSKVTGYIASFVASLFGQTYKQASQAAQGIQAATDATDGLADSTKNADKAAKGSLASFDELNDISKDKTDNSDSGGGGTASSSDAIAPIFQDDVKMPVWMEKLVAWVKDLRAMVQPGIDAVVSAVARLKESLGRLFVALEPYAEPFKVMLAALGNAVLNAAVGIIDAVKSAIDWVAENLAPNKPLGQAITWLMTFVAENADNIVRTILVAWATIKAIKIVSSIVSAISAIATLIAAHPIAAAVIAVIALAALLIANWDKVGPFFKNLIDKIKGFFDFWMQGIKDGLNATKANWDNLCKSVSTWWSTLMSNIGKWFDNRKKEFDAGIKAIREWWNGLCKNISTWWRNLMDNIGKWFNDRKKELGAGIDAIKGWWNGLWSSVSEFTQKAFDNIGKWFSDLKDGFHAGIDAIGKWFGSMWDGVASWTSKTFNKIKDTIVGVFEKIGTTVKNIWDGMWNGIKSVINSIIKGINSLIRGLNKIRIDIPEWVPLIGGSTWGFNLKEIPTFAQGGFPEDGLFAANHGELIGKFSNGKTAVANNDQIVSGIKQGVYDAVLSAMADSTAGAGGASDASSVEGDISVDGTVFGSVIVRMIRNEERRTGKKFLVATT